MIDPTPAAKILVEHGVLGALVVLQFFVILWLINRLANKVNGEARRLDKLEQQVAQLEEPPDK